MNDRFKFRFWDKEDCSYFEPQTFDGVWFDKGGRLHIGCYSDFTQDIEDYNNEIIIEQCTGLKDKNGKLIYEGDKVEISVFGGVTNEGFVETDTLYQGIVVWAKQGFYVEDVDGFFYIPEEPEDVEIIGNIHEQAEQKDK